MKEKIIEYINILMPGIDPDKLNFDVDNAIDEVLAYCCIDEIPERLCRPIASYIVSSQNAVSGDIQSIKEGDTTITYRAGEGNSSGIVKSLQTQLNKYRRMRSL